MKLNRHVSTIPLTIPTLHDAFASHRCLETHSKPTGAPPNAALEKSPPSPTTDYKLRELTMLSITPVLRFLHRWWSEQAEHHYLICADVEAQRAREAQMNVAYYQKRAALVRLARKR